MDSSHSRCPRLVGIPLVLMLVVSSTLGGAEVCAETLIERDDLELSLSAWGQAGLQVTEDDRDFYIGMARLDGHVVRPGVGEFRLQTESAGEETELLDLIATIEVIRALRIKAGLFKAPLSAEFLIPGPDHPFVNRAWLIELVPLRLRGAGVIGGHKLGPVAIEAEVAAMQSEPSADTETEWVVGRLAVDPLSGVRLHAGFASGRIGRADVRQEDDVQLGDVALVISQRLWWLHVEYVRVRGGDAEGDTSAAVVMIGFPLPLGKYVIEPGAGYDYLELDERFHRGRLGTTLYLASNRLAVSLNGELDNRTEDRAWTGYLQVQAGF